MSAYLDTSLIVCAITPQAASAKVQAWLAARAPEDLLVSAWTITEVSSALSIKLRTGQLELEHRAAALSSFRQLLDESFVEIPVTALHFRAAAHFADRHELTLGAGDTLHLAVAADRGARLCTMDRRLAEASAVLGVSAELL